MAFRRMSRYPSRYSSSFSLGGPGPVSTSLQALIGANVVMFFAAAIIPGVTSLLGLRPSAVLGGAIWQLATYMFLHGGLLHIVFNMLALWMFGAELERIWGTRYFLKFYFATGIGAAVTTVIVALLPFSFAAPVMYSVTIGASGAIYGLLLAYAMYFPERPIYMYLLFPIPAKYFVLIMGAISFYSSISGTNGGVAHATHLGGLIVAYLFLKGTRVHPLAELKYRYVKWKLNRARKKFDVYSGGRESDWNRRVH
jgi:membrane associated rhomboid family serine protease